MKKIVVANWKALPETLAQAEEIVSRLDEHLRELDAATLDVVICPPMVFLEDVARILPSGVILGAQDTDPHLARLGARYVIIGHSDRRWKLGEDDATVNAKLKTALVDGLVPIVCLGERSRQGNWHDELAAQTVATFEGLASEQIAHCLIAYEPVWAISTSPDARPDTPASAVQSLSLIRDTLADSYGLSPMTFLYGGSVTPVNAHDFLERPEISGVLVGGASVRPVDFAQILTTASHL
jgi:triosephosphate isomerase